MYRTSLESQFNVAFTSQGFVCHSLSGTLMPIFEGFFIFLLSYFFCLSNS